MSKLWTFSSRVSESSIFEDMRDLKSFNFCHQVIKKSLKNVITCLITFFDRFLIDFRFQHGPNIVLKSIKNIIKKLMVCWSLCLSIFDRFWLDCGVPNRRLNFLRGLFLEVPNLQKLSSRLHESSIFIILTCWYQDRNLIDFGANLGSKIEQKSIKNRSKNWSEKWLIFWSIFHWFLVGLGGQVGSKIDQKSSQDRSKNHTKTVCKKNFKK